MDADRGYIGVDADGFASAHLLGPAGEGEGVRAQEA
jgi:hypothetical protein